MNNNYPKVIRQSSSAAAAAAEKGTRNKEQEEKKNYGLVSQLTAICCEAATKERDREREKAKAKSSCKCRRQHLAYLAGAQGCRGSRGGGRELPVTVTVTVIL